jgi:hypothetical protein
MTRPMSVSDRVRSALGDNPRDPNYEVEERRRRRIRRWPRPRIRF